MNRPAPAPSSVTRARVLLVGLFALAGLAFSSWLARVPTVRDQLGLSTADLGVLLLVGSVGSLLTVTVAGGVLQRHGTRRVLLASTALLATALVLLGVAPGAGSRALLAAGIFVNGVAVALGNVAINVESGRVERAVGRTVIPQFHAAFSVGAVAGSGLGALASALGVPVVVQLPATAVLVVVWRLASLRDVVLPATPAERAARAGTGTPAPDGPPRARRGGGALRAWREPRTLGVGVVVLAAALSEGSANNWLALAVVDGFASPEHVGGAVLGLFVAAMTVVRLLGTRLLDRWGRVGVLRASGVLSVLGLATFGLAPTLPLAVVGVALWGAGAALAVPVGMAAASDDPVRAAGRVAVVSAFASVASLAAPPVLGLAAEHVGARHALLLVLVAMLVSVLVAPVVRPRPPVAVPGVTPRVTGGLPADAPGTAPGAAVDVVRPDAPGARRHDGGPRRGRPAPGRPALPRTPRPRRTPRGADR
ncbi:sugar MFS transporter [Cellulomonas sp. SLBN-39]|uniref:MFS transporter n=1 Tax=Cellulomonas sp. SLBN-39 TaxID=2768446 RepID=UPI0011698073|nr:MFS transporter [Cellulomonas sp. SLBN-39]TQL03336.1 fucose permease [Cellulomonas sp. SLBN-39]